MVLVGLQFKGEPVGCILAIASKHPGALPDWKLEDQNNYWSGVVHLVFHDNGVERISPLLRERFGLNSGDLLAGCEDFVGMFDLCDVAFTQLGGVLTVDESDAAFGDEDRADFHPCARASLGRIR